MRNPANSWHLIDSSELDQVGNCQLGEQDLNLAQHLTLAGQEHGKFLRFIRVCFDLTAPLYWWKEFETYKFAEKNSSCLTDRNEQILHHNNLFTTYKPQERNNEEDNESRKTIFRKHTQNLPNSYIQKRTVITNYAELRNIYFQCRNHNLDEWWEFCDWVKETLPYAEDLICPEKSEVKN